MIKITYKNKTLVALHPSGIETIMTLADLQTLKSNEQARQIFFNKSLADITTHITKTEQS